MNQSYQLSNADLRKQIRQARRSLPLTIRRDAEQSIYQQISQHPKVSAAQHIAIFLSFDGELATQPIIESLWQQNKTVYLPMIHPFSPDHLLFLRYDKTTQLQKNRLGILAPELDINAVMPYHKLDVIFTPLVAFDQRNYRIGMGRGYYDRLLENYRQKNIYPIGLAFQCQKVEQIANQPWDVQLPEIISA